nr:haloacid dehalogenase type II [Rhodococcus sp. HNM0569]
MFDVQGTLLDFHTPVTAALSAHLPEAPTDLPARIARRWRTEYFTRVAALDQSVNRWTRVQDVYADALPAVAAEFGVEIDDTRARELADAWRRLLPWPDTVEGIRTLRQSALVAPLSNTDMATVIGMSKRLGIDWDAVLTAEAFGAFKPEARVYERALRFLGIDDPSRAVMVASHPYDLRAAREHGMRTVFVYRPLEHGDARYAEDATEFDHRVDDVRDIP